MSDRNCTTCGSNLLDERGIKQAYRNDSTSIWSAFNCDVSIIECNHQITRCHSARQYNKNTSLEPSSEFVRSGRDYIKEQGQDQEMIKMQKKEQDNSLKQQQNYLIKRKGIKQQQKVQQKTIFKKEQSKKFVQNKQDLGEKEANSSKNKIERELRPNRILSSTVNMVDQQRKNEIQKYLDSRLAYTRTMPNSTIQLFYGKPCLESYGARTSSIGASSSEHMKTHSVVPHSYTNYPVNYQSKTSALNFAKRTRKDPEERWIKIQRMLSKSLDFKKTVNRKADGFIDVDQAQKEEVLKYNKNDINGLSIRFEQKSKAKVQRTKSADKIKEKSRFIVAQEKQNAVHLLFKYHQKNIGGYDITRYARDRHGLTCYVDSTFKQNEQAFLNFQKKKNPILPEPCKPSDRNIQAIRLQNHQQFIDNNYPRHYLNSNVEVPYDVTKYTKKKDFNLSKQTVQTSI